jgi:hypothetical protein
MFTKPSGPYETLTEKYPKFADYFRAMGKRDENVNQCTEDHFIHESLIPPFADSLRRSGYYNESPVVREKGLMKTKKESLTEKYSELTAIMVRMGQKIEDLSSLEENQFLARAGYLSMKEKLDETDYFSKSLV